MVLFTKEKQEELDSLKEKEKRLMEDRMDEGIKHYEEVDKLKAEKESDDILLNEQRQTILDQKKRLNAKDALVEKLRGECRAQREQWGQYMGQL